MGGGLTGGRVSTFKGEKDRKFTYFTTQMSKRKSITQDYTHLGSVGDKHAVSESSNT